MGLSLILVTALLTCWDSHLCICVWTEQLPFILLGPLSINSTVLLSGSLCCHRGLQDWELLGAGAPWPSTQLKHWAARKLRTTPGRWFSLTAEHNLPASCSHCSRALCKLSRVSAATGTSSTKTRKLLCFWTVIWGSKGGLNVILWWQCHLPQALSSSQSSSLVQTDAQALQEVPAFQAWTDCLL